MDFDLPFLAWYSPKIDKSIAYIYRER
jgi:hypothetical protein